MNESLPPRQGNAAIWKNPALRLFGMLVVALAAGLVIHHVTGPRHAAAAPAVAAIPATPTPAADGSTPAADGLPGQAGLELLPIVREDVPDENSVRHFILHIPIKARAGVAIDAEGVVIEVIFYDILGGEKVVETSATVKSRWATLPADWVSTDTEQLDVEYWLPKPDANAAALPEERKFFGYTVRAYYQEKLQATVAEPGRLAELYPAAAKLARKPVPVKDPIAGVDIGQAPLTMNGHAASPSGSAGGSTLDLFPVKLDEKADANSTKHLLLHIPIKAKRGAQIEVKKVVIDVLFYDIVGGAMVVPTRANVTTRWATPPADWVSTDIEELDVEYQLPKPDAQDTNPPEDRKYYGYLVRVYYQGKLQGATADPDRLRQQYPPPETLPEAPAAAASQPGATPAPAAASGPGKPAG